MSRTKMKRRGGGYGGITDESEEGWKVVDKVVVVVAEGVHAMRRGISKMRCRIRLVPVQIKHWLSVETVSFVKVFLKQHYMHRFDILICPLNENLCCQLFEIGGQKIPNNKSKCFCLTCVIANS